MVLSNISDIGTNVTSRHLKFGITQKALTLLFDVEFEVFAPVSMNNVVFRNSAQSV
jgi:hypothetical protein